MAIQNALPSYICGNALNVKTKLNYRTLLEGMRVAADRKPMVRAALGNNALIILPMSSILTLLSETTHQGPIVSERRERKLV